MSESTTNAYVEGLNQVSPKTLAIVGVIIVAGLAVYEFTKGGNSTTNPSQSTTSNPQQGSQTTPTQSTSTPISTTILPTLSTPNSNSNSLSANPSGSNYDYTVTYNTPSTYTSIVSNSNNTSNLSSNRTSSYQSTITNNNQKTTTNAPQYNSTANGPFSTAQAPYNTQGQGAGSTTTSTSNNTPLIVI